MTYVLYLNLWGTTAKLPEDKIAPCQTFFHRLVTEKAREFGVEAYPLVDYAYVYNSDLGKLVSFAAKVFEAHLFPADQTQVWPLRGAISVGAERAPELAPIPWIGIGSVRAAELEKSAQKGMRLLIDSRAMNAVVLREPTRDFAVRGTQHFEVNWLKESRIDRTRLVAACAELMSQGTNYSQQLSASLSGLLRWSEA